MNIERIKGILELAGVEFDLNKLSSIEYIKSIIENETAGLDTYCKRDLIKATQDVAYIKYCVQNNKLGLGLEDKVYLIITTKDVRFVRECILGNILGLSNQTHEALNAITSNRSNATNTPTKAINLPSKMTIGIEIESECQLLSLLDMCFNFGEWHIKKEVTLVNGREVVSPILQPDKKAVSEIYQINDALKKIGATTSTRCGGHIHIGADYLTTKESYMNLMEIWCNTEDILYVITNDEGMAPRNKNYAKPIRPKIKNMIRRRTINLNNAGDLNSFVDILKLAQDDLIKGKARDYSVNFLNVNNSKNTIEFRLANGTLDPELWIDNINLLGGMMVASEELAQIQKEGPKNDIEREKLQRLSDIKNADITREEKLAGLLYLIELSTGVDKEPYIRRYNSNKKFIALQPRGCITFDRIRVNLKNQRNKGATR